MKSTFVKVLVVVMALAMMLPLVAACKKNNPTGTTAAAGTTAGPEQTKLPWEDGKEYTYRMGPSDLPTMWNVHNYQSNSSTYVLDYASDALYGFEYNDDFTGYKIVPMMASDFPTDVTKDYIGRFGVVEGDENKVYKIPLKSNLKFDNGEPITAQSFVDSMKLLLDPRANNFRADNTYKSGDLKIYGAENYAKQGKYSLSEFVSANMGDDEYIDPKDFKVSADGILYVDGRGDIIIDITSGGNWGSNGLKAYAGAGMLDSVKAAYDALAAAADDNGWVKLTAALLKNVQDCVAALHGYANVEAYAADAGDYAYKEFEEMAFFGADMPEYKFEDVGFFADGNNLVVVLKNAMEDNFYLRYELCTNFFLVYAPLYEKCISIKDGVYSNSYGTSVDTFVGFGPYKLTKYVEGSQILLERNLTWRGYQDGEYVKGTYQTDKVSYQQVAENSTRLMMFLKGELDSYGLQKEDMEAYQSSDYTYYNDSESTWYLAMNPQFENLKKVQETATPVTAGNTVNKTVLAIEDFRKALSYSLNRADFNLQLSPTSGVAKALLSSMIVADPDSGRTYRSLDQAKDAILNFWGLADQWGEGKTYATRDEAIESITGYDPEGAKVLFTNAYNKAVADGYLSKEVIDSGKWEVQITIGKPSEANFYAKGFDFFKTCWTKAVEGTPFEGHISFVLSQTLGSTTFGEYLRNGSVDILFGVGYGGSMFNPYSMIECFTGSLQYDKFTDKSAVELDITFANDDALNGNGVDIKGKTLRASLYNWVSEALMGEKITAKVVGADGKTTGDTVELSAGASDPSARRIAILAAAETKIMTLSNIFPLMTDATASLRCMRVNYKTEDYIVGMGRGGIEWYTYSMDDAEFKAYVDKQENKQLNYK